MSERTNEEISAAMQTYAPTSGCAYSVYRQWGTMFHKEVETEKEAWDALDELRFGEGFEVRDELGHIRPEFVPF